MLASGAMTSTPGVITSFSCIGLLLSHAVPSARVAASRHEIPRTSSGAARVVRERLALSSARCILPAGCGPRPRRRLGGARLVPPLQRVADLLRLREACSSERGRTDRGLSLLPALPTLTSEEAHPSLLGMITRLPPIPPNLRCSLQH